MTPKDAGQIVTAMEIAGGYSQAGTRIIVTLIKDNGSQTRIRVVPKQKRKKLLHTEPFDAVVSDNTKGRPTSWTSDPSASTPMTRNSVVIRTAMVRSRVIL